MSYNALYPHAKYCTYLVLYLTPMWELADIWVANFMNLFDVSPSRQVVFHGSGLKKGFTVYVHHYKCVHCTILFI